MGQSRRKAYEALASRTGVPPLRKFVRAIIQADLYGIAVADVLRTQADELRIKRRQRAEEKAMQIPIKVIFPLMLCILPVLFIVLLGPAAMDIVAAFTADAPGPDPGDRNRRWGRRARTWPVGAGIGRYRVHDGCRRAFWSRSRCWAGSERPSRPRLLPSWLVTALLAVFLAVLVVVDLAVYRLPDVIVGPLYIVLFAALTLAAALSGDWGRLGRAALAAGVIAFGYLVLAFIAPSNLGLGDVKLSGLLGAFLGWLGWSHAFVGTLAAFVLGGFFALFLVVAKRAHRRTPFAFGPWMVIGAVVGAGFGSAGVV